MVVRYKERSGLLYWKLLMEMVILEHKEGREDYTT
jgi:hypothetical protein